MFFTVLKCPLGTEHLGADPPIFLYINNLFKHEAYIWLRATLSQKIHLPIIWRGRQPVGLQPARSSTNSGYSPRLSSILFRFPAFGESNLAGEVGWLDGRRRIRKPSGDRKTDSVQQFDSDIPQSPARGCLRLQKWI